MDATSTRAPARGFDPAALSGPNVDVTIDVLKAQQSALHMILTGAPLSDVLSELAETVEVLDSRSSAASILLLDSAGRLRNGAAPGLPDDYNAAIDGIPAQAELGTCAHAAATAEIVITPSIADCPRWAPLKELPLAIGLKAAWSQPIISRTGKVLGTFGTYFYECREPTSLELRLVATLAETTALAIEREAEEQQRKKHETLLQRALEAADMGAWRYEFASNLVHVDERAKELYGSAGESFLHDEASVLAVLHPDDVPGMWEAVKAASDPSGDGRYQARYRTRRADGSWRWLSVWGMAEFETVNGSREAVAIDGASRDITSAVDATEQQQLLLRELSHRVRNNLAVVQSIAHQTLRTKSNPQEFADAFNGRIAALAKAHSLLTASRWQGASLRGIAEAALEGFGGTDDSGSFTISGEDLVVPTSAAVTLSLVLHELATNAHKYGALSTSGTVELSWASRSHADGCMSVELEWRETGGPPAPVSERVGFGSRLISIGAAQLKGKADIRFEPAGLACDLSIFLPSAGEATSAAHSDDF